MVSGEWKAAHWVCVIQYSVSDRVVKRWVGEREVASRLRTCTCLHVLEGYEYYVEAQKYL